MHCDFKIGVKVQKYYVIDALWLIGEIKFTAGFFYLHYFA